MSKGERGRRGGEGGDGAGPEGLGGLREDLAFTQRGGTPGGPQAEEGGT